MGLFYEYVPPPAAEQHARLVALRQLTARGIPCILWGEDALNYVHWVPTSLFDQQILIPDDLLESASAVLQEGEYSPVSFTGRYLELWDGPHSGKSMFPKGILLKHPDIPDDEPYKLDPLPGYILLLPQSYYGLDVRSKERYQSIVPPLDPPNADILVPKYHTFLEGLVSFMMHPPIDLANPHRRGLSFHSVYIEYLLRYRVKYEGDPRGPPPPELLPEERSILSELQTDEARWFLGKYLGERVIIRIDDMLEYKNRKASVSDGPASRLCDNRRHYSTKLHGNVMRAPRATAPVDTNRILSIRPKALLMNQDAKRIGSLYRNLLLRRPPL